MIDSFINKYQKVPVEEYQNEVIDHPVVSVLVMAYNHVNYIKECLDSILMQKTDFPFEVLVGDDASSDGTRDICIQYAKLYPEKIRLFLHSRENNISINGKPSWHFNSLYNFLKLRGRFVAFCEGDDYWTDALKLQKQIGFLESNNNYSACAHLSNVTFENVDLQNEFRYKKQIDKTVFRVNDLLEYTRFHTSSLVYRKELLDINKMVECGLALNREHPIMIILASENKIKRLPEVMSTYRKNDGGISANSDTERAFKENIDMAETLTCYIKGFKLKSLYIKGHWHKFMLKSKEKTFVKKMYHFCYFSITSFYKFPRNGKEIVHAFKLLLS